MHTNLFSISPGGEKVAEGRMRGRHSNFETASRKIITRFPPHPALSLKGEGIGEPALGQVG